MPLLYALLNSLLLQAPTLAVHPYLSFGLAVAGLGFGIYAFLYRETKEAATKRTAEADGTRKAITDLQTKNEHYEQRFTGIVQENERQREHVANQFKAHDTRLNEIPPLRESQVEIKAQLKYIVESTNKLEGTISRLVERLTKS